MLIFILHLNEVVAHRKRNDLNSEVETNNSSELITYFLDNEAVSWNDDDRDSHYKLVIQQPWWKAPSKKKKISGGDFMIINQNQ